jgi:serine/threonine-protein kinase
MGVVYKAEDIRLKRFVALKFLPPELTRDVAAKERFEQEARTASALDHPNVCTIHEIDETSDGQVFICMAFYDGESLKARLARGPLSIEETLNIVIQVAEGMRQAHEHGIVHRDVKPANVMLTGDGVPKIVDFGIATLLGRPRGGETGEIAGTVSYMSPEQARGDALDQRTDIWSLGVTMYEMLTGRLPFIAEAEQSLLHAIVYEEPPPARSDLGHGLHAARSALDLVDAPEAAPGDHVAGRSRDDRAVAARGGACGPQRDPRAAEHPDRPRAAAHGSAPLHQRG